MFKVMFTTILATLISSVLITSFFLNSILGQFGLVSAPIDTFNKFRNSNDVVETLKKRHKKKNDNISSKFIERSIKKTSSTAIAAATLGFSAVFVTVAGFEVVDYCDDKKELLDEEYILFGTKKVFTYDQCWEAVKKEIPGIIEEVKKEIPSKVKATSEELWEDSKSIGSGILEEAKKVSSDVFQSSINATDKLREWVSEDNDYSSIRK